MPASAKLSKKAALRRLLFNILTFALLFTYTAWSKSCDSFTTSSDCTDLSYDACQWSSINDQCECSSTVKLDILFGIDASGSIGLNSWLIQRQFIEILVNQGININESRIGFTLFATHVNVSAPIQYWSTDDIVSYVQGLYWTSGWTNTPDLITSSLAQFATSSLTERQQILLIITDGRPCLPDSLGGCPVSVCSYANQIKAENIRVVIIAIGEFAEYYECMLQSDDDYLNITEYSLQEFDSITDPLSDILCVATPELKITEVKAAKKSSTWDSRLGRFVEIFNEGRALSLNEIDITGLLQMNTTNSNIVNVTISQGQYIVFYDASDEPLGNADVLSTPTCHLCDSSICDLSGCDSKSEAYIGYCWCDNSVYVACGNTNDETTNCDANIAVTDGYDACLACTFNDIYVGNLSHFVSAKCL